MASAVTILENRISALERQILSNCNKIEDVSTVTDSLLRAHTMISSALSCRDSITSILDNMVTINDYLDPLYSEEMIDRDDQLTYLTEEFEVLKNSYEQLGVSFKRFEKVLDSDYMRKLLENGDRIEDASAENLEIYQMSQVISQQVLELLIGYHESMDTIKMLFRQMNTILSSMELDEQPVINPEE